MAQPTYQHRLTLAVHHCKRTFVAWCMWCIFLTMGILTFLGRWEAYYGALLVGIFSLSSVQSIPSGWAVFRWSCPFGFHPFLSFSLALLATWLLQCMDPLLFSQVVGHAECTCFHLTLQQLLTTFGRSWGRPPWCAFTFSGYQSWFLLFCNLVAGLNNFFPEIAWLQPMIS